MRPVLIGILFLGSVTVGSASDNWTVTSHVDSMTDREMRSAVGLNAAGFQLKVYQVESGRVYGTFVLPETFIGVLDSQKLPMYRVDKLEPRQIQSSRALDDLLGFTGSDSEPKWIHFVLWHGQGTQVLSGVLRDLMDGKEVVFRYYLFTGGYAETAFDLSGAKEAIAEAIGVEAEADSALIAADKAYKEALGSGSDKCLSLLAVSRKRLLKCMERHTECVGRTPRTAETYNDCFHRK